MAIRKFFSQGAGIIEVDLAAIADDGEVTQELPSTAGKPLAGVYNSRGELIAPGAATYSITVASGVLTYKNLSGGAFTGILVISLVM